MSCPEALDDIERLCRTRALSNDLGPLLGVDVDPGGVYRVRFLGGVACVRADGIEVRDRAGAVLAWDAAI